MSSVTEDQFRRLVQIAAGDNTDLTVNAREYLRSRVSSEINHRDEFVYDIYEAPRGVIADGNVEMNRHFPFGSKSDRQALKNLLDVVTTLNEIQAMCLLEHVEEALVREAEHDPFVRSAEIYRKMRSIRSDV